MKLLLIFANFLTFNIAYRTGTFNDSWCESGTLNENKGISESEKANLCVFHKLFPKPSDYFTLTNIPEVSPRCAKEFKLYLNALSNFEMWALQMFDASARLSSGILSGNINNYGDFDECLNVKMPVNDGRGQYCVSYINIKVPKDMTYSHKIKSLSHSMETFRSDFDKGFDDLYHYIPLFSSFLWASCIPSSCNPQDFQRLAQRYFETHFNGTGIDVAVKTNENLCQTKSENVSYDWSSKFVLSLFVIYIFVVVLITFYDEMYLTEEQSILSSFSLTRNWKDFTSTSDSPDDIKSIHGIRFFSVVMIFLSHKSFFAYFYPMANRTDLIQEAFNGSTILIRAGNLYTEIFLLLSGLLASNSMRRTIERNKKFNFFKEYIDRYWRIAPSVGVLILFSIFVMPHIGNGPLYKMLIGREAELCSQYWWRNLLFINVWFGVRPMCAFHTQHVAVDFELFLVAPLLVMLLNKSNRKGLMTIILLIIASSCMKSFVTYKHNLSDFIIHGLTSRQLMETADLMYILPHFRFTSYAIGILTGFYMPKIQKLRISTKKIGLLWFFVSTILFVCFRFSSEIANKNYVYNPVHAALITFIPIFCCAFVVLMIIISEMKIFDTLTNILQWRFFKITSKLAYSFYLVQFVVFYFNTGTARGASHYSLFKTAIDLNELASIFIGSIGMTILVELPVKNLRKINKNRKVHGFTKEE